MNAADEHWKPQLKEAEMKGYNGPSILCAVLLFGAVLVSPAFAEMKKVDEKELARTNVSVTGTPIKKDRINCVEKDGICAETKQDRVTSDKVATVSSPAVSNTTEAIINKSMMLGGKEAFQFGMSGVNSYNRVGGTVTAVQSH
jgi:hypothetical protein